jgi:glutaredoxin
MTPPEPATHSGPVSLRSLLGLAALVLVVGGLHQWWTTRHQTGLGEAVAAQAAPGDIRMLASEVCPSCAVARRWFEQHQVAYSECLIERDPACLDEFRARQAMGTPLLVVRGTPLSGFDPAQVRAVLERTAR